MPARTHWALHYCNAPAGSCIPWGVERKYLKHEGEMLAMVPAVEALPFEQQVARVHRQCRPPLTKKLRRTAHVDRFAGSPTFAFVDMDSVHITVVTNTAAVSCSGLAFPASGALFLYLLGFFHQRLEIRVFLVPSLRVLLICKCAELLVRSTR